VECANFLTQAWQSTPPLCLPGLKNSFTTLRRRAIMGDAMRSPMVVSSLPRGESAGV